MEMDEIIKVVESKAEDIAQEEITKYSKDFPEVKLTDEIKEAAKVRSTSQLTLQLSKFRFNTDGDLEEQFNSWFQETEEEDLRKACRHSLEEEVKKMREANAGNLSSLDAYLKRHLGDVHQID